jgi:hypothetical protein
MPKLNHRFIPEKDIVGAVGDVGVPEYDGGFVYKDGDGFTLEWVIVPDEGVDFDDLAARWHVYRVALDKGVPDWGSYKSAAKTSGRKPGDLKDAFESDDPMVRAGAYIDWAGHYGWENFDESPLVLDKEAIEDRYDTEMGEGGGEGETEEDADLFSDEDMAESYVITDARRGGYDVRQGGKSVGHFKDKDEALEAIDERMEKENFFPNIYYVNERGNTDLIDPDGKILESRV